jgi:hypothetical protein
VIINIQLFITSLIIYIWTNNEQKSGKKVIIKYPLHLLKLGEGSNIMVELKSGETYNGTIKAVDKFTNIKMEAANLSDKVHS